MRPSLLVSGNPPHAAEPGPSLAVPEAVLLGVAVVALTLEPWALGAMHVPTQAAALGLAAAAMAAALWPRPDLPPGDRPGARLRAFPIFWAGLALLAYIAVQACNPAWRFVSDASSWWLVPQGHARGLPSAVSAPFDRSNAWRADVIFATPWLLACSLWAGFHRRLSYRRLFGAVVAGGSILAVVGLAQHLTGTDRIFWTYRPAHDAQFMASFIYRNHAGAYFDLVFSLALGLAAWHGRRWRRRLEDPGATVGFSFAAALLGMAVIFSASRMSIALMGLPLLAMSAGMALKPAADGTARSGRRWLAAGLPLLALGAVALVSFQAGDVRQRFSALAADPAGTLRFRGLAREAAEQMLSDRWVLGWGAGCFRYGFPLYAQHYPEIYYSASRQVKYWEHVHDDWIELPVELGAVGMVPIVVGLAWAAWRLARTRAWQSPFSLCAAAGVLATLAHGWVDFVFQNPAVLGLWGVLVVGAIRWAELDVGVGRRRGAAAVSAEPRRD